MYLIKEIELKNYRCYEHTKINFKELVIIVGKNNAGKSTLLEALRLVAFAIRKADHALYKEVPRQYNIPLRDKGFKLEVEKLKIDLRNIVFLYEDKIAHVSVMMGNGVRILITLNNEQAYAILYDKDGNNIKSSKNVTQDKIEKVDILPQISMIKPEEVHLTDGTVEAHKDSYLFSRHFRNEILRYKKDYWRDFVELTQNTWEGLKIHSIDYNSLEDENIKLFVSDNRFMAEVGMMGSGLQMWLQIMWFLCRAKESKTVILDEPDVYMHPDLQRKLIKMVRKRYPQVIIASHSVEIISEVEPENILMIDKNKRRMSYATDLKSVQNIVDNIGAVSNLSLTRIGAQRKCVFIEGDDLKTINKLVKELYPEKESLEMIPKVSLGGFNNLSEAYGVAKLFYDETRGMINCYCILDSDYFPEDMLNEKYEKARDNNLILHIWKRKELENYLLEPKVIYRIVEEKDIRYEDFLEQLEALVDQEKDNVFDQYAEHIVQYTKCNHSEANKKAREYIDSRWNALDEKLALVGGKKFISKINKWLKDSYGVSCSISAIIKKFIINDLDDEMVEVIEMLTQ